jgi:hypothetical protein
MHQACERHDTAAAHDDGAAAAACRYVWEAISHEVGHTLSLSHDGRNLPEGYEAYYQVSRQHAAAGAVQTQHTFMCVTACVSCGAPTSSGWEALMRGPLAGASGTI